MVNLILVDQEFDKIVDRMGMAIVNTCATNEHVTDAERNVCTIKDHNPPTNGGKFNAHQKGLDPAVISGGLGFEARLLVVQWLLYLFTYLTNMAAIPQPWRLLPYCGGSTHRLAANEGSN